jgi:hypothetical protein
MDLAVPALQSKERPSSPLHITLRDTAISFRPFLQAAIDRFDVTFTVIMLVQRAAGLDSNLCEKFQIAQIKTNAARHPRLPRHDTRSVNAKAYPIWR